MGTPGKKFNNLPPYSSRLGQYPSQSVDYRSQQFGGHQPPQQPNFGFYEDTQGSTKPQNNVPHFYQNKSAQEAPQRHRPYGQGRGFGRGGNFNRRNFQNREPNYRNQKGMGGNQGGSAFSQYFHPSMLEDPWQELMERHQAIHGPTVGQSATDEVEAT
ncbi:hypothetical protein KR067_009845 [Drosophila pandora]|nr:hypothetical protein KR067_009845 [Drosophila pandora]